MSNNIRNSSELNTRKKLLEYIKNLPIESVAGQLGLQLHKTGNSLQGNCPTGHPSKNERCFSINLEGNYFLCYSCRISGDVISLVREVKGYSFTQAINWIIEKNDIAHSVNLNSFGEKELTPEEIEERNRILLYADIYEKAFKWMHGLLFEEEGKETLSYLTNNRKYDLETLKESDFCYFPQVSSIKKHLASLIPEYPELVEAIPFYGGYGDNFRLAIPYRNKEGIITGFAKRATIPEGITVNGKSGIRWDSTKGVKKNDLFYLYKIKKEDPILIVEGYPDAVYLNILGMNNITAAGQGQLSRAHLEGIREKKIKNVIISFDNDEVGPSNTKSAVRLILEEGGITPFVLDPKLLSPHKDPDEYVKANGITAFQSLLKKCEKGALWIVKEIISGSDKEDQIVKSKTVSELLNITTLIDEPQLLSEVADLISGEMKIEKAVLKKMINDVKAKNKVDKYGKIKGMNGTARFLPFIEKSTSTYAYYDAEENEVYLGVGREILENILLSSEQVLPDVLPVLKVDFDVTMNERYDLVKEKFNFFVPTPCMLLKKNDIEIIPSVHFPTIERLLVNLLPETDERLRFVNWLAGILQTRQKQQTAWVFKGVQGAGKGLLLDNVLKILFGKKQAIKVEDQQLKSEFNPWLQNALIIAFNEVAHDNPTRNGVKSRIKAIITDSEVIINEKNIRNYTVTNYVNCLFFSNETIPVFIEPGDRRFNIVVTGGKLRDKEWFNDPDEFIRKLEAETPHFAQFLMNWKYDKNLAMTCIENEEKRLMVSAAMNKFEEFAYHLKRNDIVWFEANASYAVKQLYQNLDGRILKSSAQKLFADIYSRHLTTDEELGKKLGLYGIKPHRERKGGTDLHYYKWEGENK